MGVLKARLDRGWSAFQSLAASSYSGKELIPATASWYGQVS
jgi:hypothetical protein